MLVNKPPQATRRHSTTYTPDNVPISRDNLVSARPTQTDMASTWATYSGELRSPTQRPNELIGTTKLSAPMSENKNLKHMYQIPNNNNSNGNNNGNGNLNDNNSDNDNFPPPPPLARNQSRSADSKPNYLLNDHYFGTTKGLERDSRERERSISVDKDRLNLRSGRPPQHVIFILLFHYLLLFFQ